MLRLTGSGDFRNTNAFLDAIADSKPITSRIESMAQQGVQALRAATPQDSGVTAASWDYEIDGDTIWWVNTNTVDGFNIAVGLQYGHATGNGGYVSGYDYINPALKPIFDKIADAAWEEVRKA